MTEEDSKDTLEKILTQQKYTNYILIALFLLIGAIVATLSGNSIDWEVVFSFIAIIVIVGLLVYFGLKYYMKLDAEDIIDPDK